MVQMWICFKKNNYLVDGEPQQLQQTDQQIDTMQRGCRDKSLKKPKGKKYNSNKVDQNKGPKEMIKIKAVLKSPWSVTFHRLNSSVFPLLQKKKYNKQKIWKEFKFKAIWFKCFSIYLHVSEEKPKRTVWHMQMHRQDTHKWVPVPACVYYVLYTLVFVVADKLGTGEPDLLRYIWGTQILTLPALPQPEQPDRRHKHYSSSVCLNSKESTNHHDCVRKSADHLEVSPLFKRQDDEVSVQTKDPKGQETLG